MARRGPVTTRMVPSTKSPAAVEPQTSSPTKRWRVRLIVTGGAGFIGSAVCRNLIANTGWLAVNVDKLTYAANLASLEGIAKSSRYRLIEVDIADRNAIRSVIDEIRPDAILESCGRVALIALSMRRTTSFAPTSTGLLSYWKKQGATGSRSPRHGLRPSASIMCPPTRYSDRLVATASSPRSP